ncbi:sigma factor [Erythrobacter ani]|uniref:Sigma-70 family RNA polymerase sigma factor n=1 Tax=Erythrobacter ani TaxID=2827235 RepID=A0ABS6SLZ3_9SPHN|nr:sigma factor [Erythrobacter ani]MBV7265659.1 sigma-70 family RNA polymerase sigma factor [Erythrobacter ani]
MAGENAVPRGPGGAIERIAHRLSAGSGTAYGSTGRDQAFVELLALLAPRIAGMIRRYGLSDMRDDAEQVAALGVHRALATYDPAKASFSTHATWQIRGELQGLRHRMRLDQRRGARRTGIRTVSIEALQVRSALGVSARDFEVVDESALERSERAASDSLTHIVVDQLLERLSAPEHERAIVIEYLFERELKPAEAGHRSSEQRRQIVRRTFRNCAKIMQR